MEEDDPSAMRSQAPHHTLDDFCGRDATPVIALYVYTERNEPPSGKVGVKDGRSAEAGVAEKGSKCRMFVAQYTADRSKTAADLVATSSLIANAV
ncbi:hypothetical protein OICFNHDK_3853 [Methylobacterium bullatum]|uniref:Uncharacterized protein n=1 Tax=Methylobacterium bullatum TaxID=570505 RepID=A0AAV4ZBX4_9HYPH|nr:hypothetical protein [Methylobacterium bullatum]GJD41370.1 hypothetical protein OICFNHDK_3853 [Methylobacterium bullatum]